MKIKLSKSQWEAVGKTAGWMKKANCEEKMIPGQTPYTPEEKKKLNGLISDAAEGDPGEQGENKAILSKRVDSVTATIKAILLDPEKNQYQKRKEISEIMGQNRDIFPQ